MRRLIWRWRRGLGLVCMLALLLCPLESRATETPAESPSKLQYVVKSTYVLAAAAAVVILIQALRRPPEDVSRLGEATRALDRALERARLTAAAPTPR